MLAHLEVSKGGRGRHSRLFHWLFKRAADFDQMFKEHRPTWASLAKAAAALKLEDGAGKSPSGERMRKTWFEVRRVKGWLEKTPLPKPVPIARPAFPPLLPAEARLNGSDEARPPARAFRTAALRNHMPSIAPPALPAQSGPQLDPDPDRANQVIEAMLSGAPRNRFRPDNGE